MKTLTLEVKELILLIFGFYTSIFLEEIVCNYSVDVYSFNQ